MVRWESTFYMGMIYIYDRRVQFSYEGVFFRAVHFPLKLSQHIQKTPTTPSRLFTLHYFLYSFFTCPMQPEACLAKTFFVSFLHSIQNLWAPLPFECIFLVTSLFLWVPQGSSLLILGVSQASLVVLRVLEYYRVSQGSSGFHRVHQVHQCSLGSPLEFLRVSYSFFKVLQD